MICVRCDRGIRPEEPYDTHIHHGATFAGCTNHTHRNCPEPHRTSIDKSPAPAPGATVGR